MAAVRELIQNARDAVALKTAVARTDFERASLSLPVTVKLSTEEPASLEIVDFGIGMSRRVMTDYLVSIASDYWESDQFFSDFPSALDKGFKPAGKFGIGFISVFMLGDQVQVDSNRDGGERLRLTLRGVGRRGELRTLSAPPGSGTSVKVRVSQESVGRLNDFPDRCKAFAPMLPHDLRVEVDGIVTNIKKSWWKELGINEFAKWAHGAIGFLRTAGDRSARAGNWPWWVLGHRMTRGVHREEFPPTWPGDWPEWLSDKCRLVAHPYYNTSIVCLKGLALTTVFTPGFVGLFNSETVTPNVSRRQALDLDIDQILSDAKEAVRASVVSNLNLLGKEGFVTNKTNFLAECTKYYGREVILEADVPWISVVRPPGEVALLTSKGLLRALANTKQVLVGFGTGPWTAMKRWAPMQLSSFDNSVAIVLDDTELDHLPYASEDRSGVLAELWPDCLKSPLFGAVVDLLAEAWQSVATDLVKEDGWDLRSSTLFGFFKKT